MLLWAGGTLLVVIALLIFFLAVIDVDRKIPENFSRGDQCETLNVDGTVLEPQNTWSNLGYLFAGLLIFYRSRRLRGIVLGLFLCLTGVFSAMYHAVPTNGTLQTLDIAGVYWILLAMIGYAKMSLDTRLQDAEPALFVEKVLAVAAFFVGLVMAVTRYEVFLFESTLATVIMMVILIVFLIGGMLLRIRRQAALSRREVGGYVMGLLMLGLFAGAFRLGDGPGRVLCDPNGPFQFHALWHLFSAMMLLVTYDYFTRVSNTQGERIFAD